MEQWIWPLPGRYPLLPEGQGKFGEKRKFDTHTGVDLYGPVGHSVVAVESGWVVAIDWTFTGGADSPWWEQTAAVLVEGESGVVLYGEISPLVQVGDFVPQGTQIGSILSVLRIKPGKTYPNPTSMLHLELYRTGSRVAVWWKAGEERPESLLDPTDLLEQIPPPPGVIPAGIGVIQNDFGEVLMLLRYPQDRTTSGWGFPGGKIELGEALPTGVAREVEQETGFQVRFQNYIGASRSGAFDIHAVRTIIVGGELRRFPTEEHQEARWVTPKDMLESGQDLAGSFTRELLVRLSSP